MGNKRLDQLLTTSLPTLDHWYRCHAVRSGCPRHISTPGHEAGSNTTAAKVIDPRAPSVRTQIGVVRSASRVLTSDADWTTSRCAFAKSNRRCDDATYPDATSLL